MSDDIYSSIKLKFTNLFNEISVNNIQQNVENIENVTTERVDLVKHLNDKILNI